MTGLIQRVVLGGLAAAAIAFGAGAGGGAVSAQDAVTIQVGGRYFAEPATVDILVAVAPNEENRVLRVEADGQNFYRSSDLAMTASDRKYYSVLFKNLPGGNYVIRAVLLSRDRELAVAQTALVVMSK